MSSTWLPVGAPRESELVDAMRAFVRAESLDLEAAWKVLAPRLQHVEFDAAFEVVAAAIDARLHDLLTPGDFATFRALVCFASVASPSRLTRWMRPMTKHPSRYARSFATSLLKRQDPHDVGLGSDAGEVGWRAWDAGLVHRHGKGGLERRELDHEARRKRAGVPEIGSVGELRSLLRIASPAQLRWLLTATDQPRGDAGAPYARFTIPKRGGERREICAPRSTLREVQRRIYEHVLKPVRVHGAAHGFVPGRSIMTNAAAHQGRRTVVKFDLYDFFPSIHYWRVMGLFTSLGYKSVRGLFGHADEHESVAGTLARLCCFAAAPGRAYAPQGAPTSPAISNLVCRRLDARLSGLAQRIDGTYTRYADDLTFSFDASPPGGIGRLRWWVEQIAHQEAFTVHHRKFRVQRAGRRQRVTGLVVNAGVGVPRPERRRLRAIVHNAERTGAAGQAEVWAERTGRSATEFEAWLRGYGAWVAMVHPDEGALASRIDALFAPESP